MSQRVIFFTGLPCSGKTTLARKLATWLDAEFLDGDELRNLGTAQGVKLGFSKEERKSNLKVLGFWARKLAKYNDVVCSFIAPYEDVRSQLHVDVMIYVKCDPKVCEQRDVKGMWAKARKGEIQNFTGVSDPYEPPLHPHLTVETDKHSIEECFDQILRFLRQRDMKSFEYQA